MLDGSADASVERIDGNVQKNAGKTCMKDRGKVKQILSFHKDRIGAQKTHLVTLWAYSGKEILCYLPS
jgi:hypothetical protein